MIKSRCKIKICKKLYLHIKPSGTMYAISPSVCSVSNAIIMCHLGLNVFRSDCSSSSFPCPHTPHHILFQKMGFSKGNKTKTSRIYLLYSTTGAGWQPLTVHLNAQKWRSEVFRSAVKSWKNIFERPTLVKQQKSPYQSQSHNLLLCTRTPWC